MNGFNRELWRRFTALATPYWQLGKRWEARGLLALLVALLLGQTGFTVLFNNQSGEFTSALAARDGARFWSSIHVFIGLLIVAVPIYALYYYVRDALGLRWRRWLTRSLLEKYFAERRFYQLNANPDIDNPDQRIAEDVNTFTQKSLSFLLLAIGALLQLLAFSGVLWSISKSLVSFLLFYAAIGTLVTFGVFGKRLVALNFNQLKREADFRFSLMRIRENAESIAFYRGETEEAAQVDRRFDGVFDNFDKLIRWALNLNFFQYAYTFLTIVLPSIIIAPRVLSGELEVGRVVQVAGAFAAILSALTVFIDNFESLSRFAAGIERLDAFSVFMNKTTRPAASGADSVIGFAEHTHLAFQTVTLQTPDLSRILVRDLSLIVEPGQGLLIVGVSGGGKSSLLRAIAGLWNAGAGTILRPKSTDILFLPQHAYMILGSLRTQLLYPGHTRVIADRELKDVLDEVNLGGLVERCGGLDNELDFGKFLSVGEQQRLAIARALLTQPEYTILDEATSALDADNEARLYRCLQGTATTLVSVSHRPGILQYHHQVLELKGNGEWQVFPARGYQFDRSGEA